MATNGSTEVQIARRPPFLFPHRSFEDLMHAFDERWPFGMLRREAAIPPVDMFERNGNVVVKAEMPGIVGDKIDVSVSGNELRISGERAEEKEVKDEHFYRSERSVGHVYRSLTLPEGCDTDAIGASYKDGVVEVVIPRKPAAATKKIDVKRA
jgi:HSP20 family protein